MTRAVTIAVTTAIAALDTAQQLLPSVHDLVPNGVAAWVNVAVLVGLAALHALQKAETATEPADPAQPKETTQ